MSPLPALIPPNTKRIAKLIKSMRDRLSITGVVITHDIGTAYEVSDRVAFLYEGEIIFSGTVPEARESNISTFRNFLDSKM